MDNPGTPTTQKNRLHPLVATAAGAVIVGALAATAAVTGVFPKAGGASAQNDQTQAAQVTTQAVVDSAQPANPAKYAQQETPAEPQPQAQPQPAPQAPAAQQQSPQYGQQPQPYPQQPPEQAAPQYAQQQAPQPSYCQSCGTVEAISAVKTEGHGTGIGAVGGAVAGGLIGNQFGAGTGRAAMTVLGAVGGGFAGNSVEKHLRSTTSYSVRVRMETGKTRYFTYHEAPPFQQGQRVRVQNGTLVAG